ncbi:hypothetical protein ATM97_23690 [Nocardia sp. MH4]|uniref:hypothetical protein n=1 Tax=Nocardia sp. MH4 TaxID=1768677 RepID=UPI001C4EE4EE|nr:hypothetical protein [Nocardia sp. MH4]MBW0273091.1 hypothetical protein [Nocardia sp. MH4]
MYAKFDTTATPRSHNRRWIAATVLGALAALTTIAIVSAPESTAGSPTFTCAEITSPSGAVTGFGPSNTETGPGAILGFNYAYYVQRSPGQARRFLTGDALLRSGDRLQAGIDATPAGTHHCVTISPLVSLGDADLWAVTVTEYHPDREPFAPRQIITTRNLDGTTRISSIARA